MGDFTQKMGLATWDQSLDRYDYIQLSNNWQIVDFHDHSPGRGVQIGPGGIAPGAIGPTHFSSAVVTQGAFTSRPSAGVFGRRYYATDNNQWYMDNGVAWQTIHTTNGAVNIPGSESRTNTAYGLMPTADQVTGIVLPANGLIRVGYQAMWQESVSGMGQAALFIGSDQVKVQAGASRQPLAQNAITAGGTAAINVPLFSCPAGLASVKASAGYSSDVTTGQAVGFVSSATGDEAALSVGGNPILIPFDMSFGGPCDIFATAGTYVVSVQFKAQSGSITASNRQLWVQALDFSG